MIYKLIRVELIFWFWSAQKLSWSFDRHQKTILIHWLQFDPGRGRKYRVH